MVYVVLLLLYLGTAKIVEFVGIPLDSTAGTVSVWSIYLLLGHSVLETFEAERRQKDH